MVNAVKVFTLRLCISAYYIHFKRVKVKIFTAFTIKTRYGMSRVMCKLDGTAKTDLVFAILAMNAFRKLREDILRLLLRWRRWLVITLLCGERVFQ